jgi:hypothetical protein
VRKKKIGQIRLSPISAMHEPSGMKCCEFEERVRQAFSDYEGEVPPYNALGPNSNTFIETVIKMAGGTGDFPTNAYGASNRIIDVDPRAGGIPK